MYDFLCKGHKHAMGSYLSTVISYVVQMLFIYVSCVSEEATLQSLPLTESPTLKKEKSSLYVRPVANKLLGKEKKGANLMC
jgi:hypothetical protein